MNVLHHAAPKNINTRMVKTDKPNEIRTDLLFQKEHLDQAGPTVHARLDVCSSFHYRSAVE